MKKDKDFIDISCPIPKSQYKTIQLAHGSGGQLSNSLISELFLSAFNNDELNKQNDSAILNLKNAKLAFSTDSFVVDPIFFPGGDIGMLAVHGTVNDIAMSGAIPKYLSCSFIIEEGFPVDDLEKIVLSMKEAALNSGVTIVTGDTKVVNKGKGDKIFVNTSGIGVIEHSFDIGAEHITPGDMIILSGSIADHGMCILSQREKLQIEPAIVSDTAPLHGLVKEVLKEGGSAVHAFRDPTRGGIAASLNEFALTANVGIEIHEDALPIATSVKSTCEILGIDPLYVANEGKCLVVVEERSAGKVLDTMRIHEFGKDSAIIGRVTDESPGQVKIKSVLNTWRFVDLPVGEQLPRIC